MMTTSRLQQTSALRCSYHSAPSQRPVPQLVIADVVQTLDTPFLHAVVAAPRRALDGRTAAAR
eukprot:459623-Hanusia_phi.AAC.3